MALAALRLGEGAPLVRETLETRAWRWPFHVATGLAAVLALAALARRRYRAARAAAVAQTIPCPSAAVAASQYPFLVVPDGHSSCSAAAIDHARSCSPRSRLASPCSRRAS